MSDADKVETENDTEIWALYNAVGMATKSEVQRIRLLTMISRLNSRIRGEASDKKKEHEEAAESFQTRARQIASFSAQWKETKVLGRPGFLIKNPALGISVPTLLTTLDTGIKGFNEANMVAQNPALLALVDEMVGYAQQENILDPKKKRNSEAFKQAIGRYTSSSESFWGSSDVEVLND